MKIEFNQIIKELNIPANESEIIFERLIECYSESHRDYHNLRHIREMLECIKLHKEDISDYPLLYISCLYHDIVYDTHASDNEEKSAEYLERDFKKYLPKEKIEKCKDLILGTKKHQFVRDDFDTKIFCKFTFK